MRKIIILGALLLFALNNSVAQIIPIEDFENYKQDLPDGAYIKDVNHLLDKYVATWRGTFNKKNYEFVIIKITKTYTDLKFKEDLLLIRYKITDTKGKVLEDTTALPDDNVYVIEGWYMAKRGTYYYVLTYAGKKCGQGGDIFIEIINNSKEKKMALFLVRGFELGCDNPQPQIMPTNKDPIFILKKQ